MKKELEEFLLSSRLFKGVDEEDAKRVLASAFPAQHIYMPGEVLTEERAVSSSFGVVCTGTLSAERQLTSGDSHIIDLYEPGDFFGLENAVTKSRVSPVRIKALEKSEVVIFYLEHLMVGIADEKIKENIISTLANDGIRKLYKIDILTRAGLRERVMTYFRLRAAKTGSNTFRTGMTQEALARYLSVNRSALSKELNDMRRDGLIDFKRDQVTLHEE